MDRGSLGTALRSVRFPLPEEHAERPPYRLQRGQNAVLIGRLLASRLQGDELVAEIDEGHAFAFAAQLKFEQTPIKG
jgi:hypothetical protein